jgi:hypothetical protein
VGDGVAVTVGDGVAVTVGEAVAVSVGAVIEGGVTVGAKVSVALACLSDAQWASGWVRAMA